MDASNEAGLPVRTSWLTAASVGAGVGNDGLPVIRVTMFSAYAMSAGTLLGRARVTIERLTTWTAVDMTIHFSLAAIERPG